LQETEVMSGVGEGRLYHRAQKAFCIRKALFAAEISPALEKRGLLGREVAVLPE